MRIAFFTDTFLPQVNGVSNTLMQYSRYLTQRGIAHVFYTPAYKDHKADDGTYPVVRFPSVPFALYPQVRLALPAQASLRRHLQAFQPDVVHIVTEFGMGLAGLKAARQMNLPIVMSYHTNFDQYLSHYGLTLLEEPLWQYMRWFHSFAHKTFCPSDNTLHKLTFRGIENLAVWSRGIDHTRFSPEFRSAALRRKLGAEGKLLYLYVGRISAEKGIDVYADSIRAFNKRHKNEARFVFTGDGPFLPSLKAMNIGNAVFTGTLRGRALSEIYASCDVFVFPSDNETFGNVMLEAMASGTPGICVDAGGLKDFTAHGENALCLRAAQCPRARRTPWIAMMVGTPARARSAQARCGRPPKAKLGRQYLIGLLRMYNIPFALPVRKGRISSGFVFERTEPYAKLHGALSIRTGYFGNPQFHAPAARDRLSKRIRHRPAGAGYLFHLSDGEKPQPPSLRPEMARLAQPTRCLRLSFQQKPKKASSFAYTLGLLCHYFLDSACHLLCV